MSEVTGLASWVPKTDDPDVEVRTGIYTNLAVSSEMLAADRRAVELDAAIRDMRMRTEDAYRLAQAQLSSTLFASDRNGPSLWPTPVAPPIPWYRRAWSAVDDAFEWCLGAIGLCRVSRAHEHFDPMDE